MQAEFARMWRCFSDPTAPGVCSLNQIFSNLSMGPRLLFSRNREPPIHPTIVPTYKAVEPNKGHVLIINNYKFENYKNIHASSAKVDEQNLKNMFEKLGFRVHILRNLGVQMMLAELWKFSSLRCLYEADICILYILSQGMGNSKGISHVYGIDNNKLDVSKIINILSPPSMAFKPKIFFFDCSRGAGQIPMYTKSSLSKIFRRGPIKGYVFKDVLIAHSMLADFPINCGKVKCSVYTRMVCKVFTKFAHEMDVQEMLMLVNSELQKWYGDKYASNFDNRGFMKCYIKPNEVTVFTCTL